LVILGITIGSTYSAFSSKATATGTLTFAINGHKGMISIPNAVVRYDTTTNENIFVIIPQAHYSAPISVSAYILTSTPTDTQWNNAPTGWGDPVADVLTYTSGTITIKDTKLMSLNAKALYITGECTGASVTLTLNNNGSTSSVTSVYGQTLSNITPPTRTGYTFKGYFTGENGTGLQVYGANGQGTVSNFTTNTTVYAYWLANDLTFDNQTLNNASYGTVYTSNAFTAVTGGSGSYIYTIINDGGTGATLNSSNRTISFPSATIAVGTYKITVQATDSTLNKKIDSTMTITINKGNINPTVSMSGYTYAGTKQNPTISGNTGNGTVTYYYNTSNSNSGGTAWSTVSNATSLNAGTYYMYATVGATAGYNGATTSAVEFKISKASGSISYGTTSVSKTIEDASFTNPLTRSGDGVVSYTSSETSVATVNSTSGLVTFVTTGTTIITATVTDGTNYTYATKTISYTLTIIILVRVDLYMCAVERTLYWYYSDTQPDINDSNWNAIGNEWEGKVYQISVEYSEGAKFWFKHRYEIDYYYLNEDNTCGDFITRTSGSSSYKVSESRIQFQDGDRYYINNWDFCFTGDTLVWCDNGTENGEYKRIDEIEVGDKVFSYNIDANQVESKEVINHFEREEVYYQMVKIIINGVELKSTYEHPFYLSNGEVKRATELQAGDILKTDSGEIVIEEVIHYQELVVTYNLTVADNHNYFVTTNNLLVQDTLK